ncbi:MAG: hypothetical protein K0R62_4224 [Nonomuraea muscovyensis]|nr:hypothetical protein [Nonomuraea muscovyensis]
MSPVDVTPVLVVSAHLDDAVLSWGGTIAALTRRGVRVVVLTVFAGCGGDPLPPYAEQYHSWWRASGTVAAAVAATAAEGMRLRRAEDARACAALAAEPVHLDFTEALYRRRADGSPRCAAGDDLFSAPDPDDLALQRAVAGALGGWIAELVPGEVHAPAAVGGHLDHVLTARACASALRDGPPGRWYEDLPYAMEPPEPGVPAAGLGPAAASPLTGGDWRRKVAAAAAYRSQHPMLWDDDWPDRLLAHAREAGGGTPAERHWAAAPGSNGDH